MKSDLEKLLALQELDLRLRNLGIRVKLLPKELDDLKKELAGKKEAVAAAKEKLQRYELDIKQCESNIESEKEIICKLGAQSNMVKKNDEYNALLQEIEHHKEKVSEFETQEIELLDKIEEAREEFKSLEKNLVPVEKGLKEEMQEIIDLAGELKSEIAKVKEARIRAEAQVNAELLATYKRLLDKGQGTPVSKINDGSCSNCHLQVVPQIINQALKDGYAVCNNCGFLIYAED